MECKKHRYELGAGVCASCLRDRLLALQIASRDGRSPDISQYLSPPPPPLPPLAFPRSGSPSHLRPQRSRFFSTPQVGPNGNAGYSFCEKKNGRMLSLLSSLFGISKSYETRSPRRSSSWISGLFAKKNPPPKSESFQERGMSPERFDDDEDDDCSSDSSPGWRRPEPTPVRKFPPSRRDRGVSGFSVCLSPLVRPSSKPAAGLGISGDLRGGSSGARNYRRHASVGEASLVPSRSRKLADCGRVR